jgi:uncharacterized membrane protein YhaH (DUF805 family)
MVQHYVSAILNSLNFECRMDRRAFWYFMLTATMVSLLAFTADATTIIDALTSGKPLPALSETGKTAKLIAMLHALPIFSANIRRLRDAGRSVFSVFIILVPFVGQITLFAWLMEPSKLDAYPSLDNKYKSASPNWSDQAFR